MLSDAIQKLDSRQQYWQRNLRLWLFAVCLCLFSILALTQLGFKRGVERLIQHASQEAFVTLTMQTQILEGYLEKYRLLPVLMARNGKPVDLDNTYQTRIWLEQLTYLSGAHDVIITDRKGQIKASARYDNDYYPPLAETDIIIAPLQARLGRQYLSIDNNAQLYAFSSILKTSSDAELILVFFITLDDVFQSWALSGAEMIATDKQNVITLASQQDWIGSLGTAVDYFEQDPFYARASKTLETVGWQVTAYQRIDPSGLIRQVGYGSAALVLSIIIFFTLFIRKRELQIKSILRDRLYSAELEKQINFRTAELQSANEYLTEEIAERNHAELQLKKAQKELIHSAKLATIGQMSTTLSHEYNQPLAAMRTYAENSVKFLEKNNITAVQENLAHIIRQTDRLGQLSKTLMSFARKPNEELNQVDLSLCVNEAIMLIQPKIRNHPIDILNQITDNTFVMGRPVQISQVFINLLSNAIDAICENPQPSPTNLIVISAKLDGRFYSISIEDSGTGIAKANQEAIFDPFVTTKISGQGLGLGLSVVKDIIKDHHGFINVAQSKLGGALFQIQLPVWTIKEVHHDNES